MYAVGKTVFEAKKWIYALAQGMYASKRRKKKLRQLAMKPSVPVIVRNQFFDSLNTNVMDSINSEDF
jgi:hypothetical protein